MTHPSILILGASALQIPLIEYVKYLGYRTIVASISGNYPGFQIADRCLHVDVRNADLILEQINGENVKAVLTDQTDIAVPTVARIANVLNLQGNDVNVAKIYSNKYEMRAACQEAGIPCPKSTYVKSLKDAKDWNIFPAIIKPEDNQGSRGIYKIYSYDDLKRYFANTLSYSFNGGVIIEEFFNGEEIVVEGFVRNGEYVNFGIADRRYFKTSQHFIPAQTIFPSLLPNSTQKKLIEYETILHKHISPSFGMIHSEYLFNKKTNEIRLVETALRGGGVYISSHLIPLYTGCDNYEILIKSALGESINLDSIKRSICCKAAAYICFYLPQGKVVAIKGLEELRNKTGVVKDDIDNITVGSIIEPIENKTQRLGPIILQATNRAEIESLITNVQKTLKIYVNQVKEKDDIIWT